MPRLWNKRDPLCPPDAFYIGRPTEWGNQYSHLKNVKAFHVDSREEAVDKHSADIDKNIALTPEFKQYIIDTLRGKDLVCWCAPFGGMDFDDTRKICHGQHLGKIANS